MSGYGVVIVSRCIDSPYQRVIMKSKTNEDGSTGIGTWQGLASPTHAATRGPHGTAPHREGHVGRWVLVVEWCDVQVRSAFLTRHGHGPCPGTRTMASVSDAPSKVGVQDNTFYGVLTLFVDAQTTTSFS